MPEDLVTDCVPNNNSGGLLMPDNITLVQVPHLNCGVFYMCSLLPSTEPLLVGRLSHGTTLETQIPFRPMSASWVIIAVVVITLTPGNGSYGSHGGSGLSGFGGSIRLGELLNVSKPITHALKLELWAHKLLCRPHIASHCRYYSYNWTSGEYSSCFTWPATGFGMDEMRCC